jgi:hypothetical protein
MTAKHISRVSDLGTNRLAGLQSRKLQRLQGSFGAATRGRRLSDAEKRAVENDLKRSGRLA